MLCPVQLQCRHLRASNSLISGTTRHNQITINCVAFCYQISNFHLSNLYLLPSFCVQFCNLANFVTKKMSSLGSPRDVLVVPSSIHKGGSVILKRFQADPLSVLLSLGFMGLMILGSCEMALMSSL